VKLRTHWPKSTRFREALTEPDRRDRNHILSLLEWYTNTGNTNNDTTTLPRIKLELLLATKLTSAKKAEIKNANDTNLEST